MNAESAYQAHETLVAPGRAKSHIWRILAGLGIIAGVSYALNLGAFLLVLQLSSAADLAAVVQGSTPAAMLLVLVTWALWRWVPASRRGCCRGALCQPGRAVGASAASVYPGLFAVADCLWHRSGAAAL